MVGTCANPGCGAPFKYFREGRLFAFDSGKPDPGAAAKSPDTFTQEARGYRYFWLCGACAQDWTLRTTGADVALVRRQRAA